LVPHFTADPKGGRKPVNARAETIATTPMFRDAFQRRRCLVPADAFYEWQATQADKIPHAIARLDGEPMAFAGLWEGWRAPDGSPGGGVLRSFAIVTTTANATLRPLHERMPVVLEAADWPLWLGEVAGEPGGLLRPAGDDVLRAWPVSRRVNNVGNNGPELLTPENVSVGR